MPIFKLSIEGENAALAAEKLFETTNLKGSWIADSAPTKEGTLAVVATVVGIIGGTVAIAEQLRKWYQEYKKSKKRFDVVLVVEDVRLLLEDATVEDISAVLEELEG
jgi:deoxyribose-phosphate aldolase